MRVVIPPGAVEQPTRVNCRCQQDYHPEKRKLSQRCARYQPLTKMAFPPPFMEREALASRVVEISPPGEHFRAPVLIEIPHFASTANAERETVRDLLTTWVVVNNVVPGDSAQRRRGDLDGARVRLCQLRRDLPGCHGHCVTSQKF